MTNEEILEVVQTSIRLEVDDPRLTIDINTRASDVAGWDSLAHGRILLLLESELGVHIDIDATYRAVNVGELIAIIRTSAPQPKR